MKIKRHIIAVFLAFILCISSLLPMYATALTVDKTKLPDDTFVSTFETSSIAPGVEEAVFSVNNTDGTHQVNCFALEVDLSEPTASIIASYKDYDGSKWGMQSVRDQAFAAEKALGTNVVAGVNADFFNMGTGEPQGYLIMGGTVYKKNSKNPYFAVMNDGTAKIGCGDLDVSNTKECVSGNFMLVKDGAITEATYNINERYGLIDNPRTAIGIKADGSVVMLVTDGRQAPYSYGMSYLQLAETMYALDCVDAINLDGGGSTTFVSTDLETGNLVCKDKPSDSIERTVSTALLVCSSSNEIGKSNSTSTNNGCAATGHKFIYSPSQTYCKVCNRTVVKNLCTGLAENYSTGKIMYLIKGEPKTGWFAKGNDIYYFDKNGAAATGKTKIDGYTYTFGEDGILTKGALVKEGYYTYYYVAGTKQRGWHNIDGYWHFFDRMTGFGMATKDNTDKISIDTVKDGKYPIASTDATLLFEFHSNGRLNKGSWLETGNGKCYYMGNNERLFGWQYIDNNFFYFGNDTYVTTGTKTIDGKEYTFDRDGKLTSTDVSINAGGVYYYITPQGTIDKTHPSDHAYKKVIDEAVAPQIGKTGLTAGEHCGVCGTVMIKQEIIEALPEPTTIPTTVPTTVPTTAPTTQPPVIYSPGDVDKNGTVNAADARIVLRVASKLEELRDTEAFMLADTNSDSQITAYDARKILRVASKLEEM